MAAPLIALRGAALLGVVIAVLAADPAAARPAFDEDTALRASQAAIGRPIGEYAFTNSLNRTIRLSDLKGRPLVINMVYSGCADICPTVSESLADAVEVAREALGNDSFSVVTIGFDARHDTPERMRAYARSHGLNIAGWEFLSGDADTIDSLAADLGFLFFAAPQGFDHVAQTTILDAEGRIHRQIYGATFAPPTLVEPLKDLIWGRSAGATTIGALVDRVRLICTIYDAGSGRYRFSYAILIGVGLGGATLLAIGLVIVRAWLRLRRRERAVAATGNPGVRTP